jgi:hypothetical protein
VLTLPLPARSGVLTTYSAALPSGLTCGSSAAASLKPSSTVNGAICVCTLAF